LWILAEVARGAHRLWPGSQQRLILLYERDTMLSPAWTGQLKGWSGR